MGEKYMRGIAAVGNGKVELVRDVPIPEIGPYEALVRMKSCGFCNGTDFHIIKGEMSVEVDAFPTLIGHEGVGDIVEPWEQGKELQSWRPVYESGSQDHARDPVWLHLGSHVRLYRGAGPGGNDRGRRVGIASKSKAGGVCPDPVRFRHI